MKLWPNFITPLDEDYLAGKIDGALNRLPENNGEGRSRIRRYGRDYTNPTIWLGEIPDWIPHLTPVPFLYDSVTLNEYKRGQAISPHIDSDKFGDVAILSLLADATMRFISPVGQEKDYVLPRRSLAVMSGELRSAWKHETMPLDAERRYSVVYRLRLAHK